MRFSLVLALLGVTQAAAMNDKLAMDIQELKDEMIFVQDMAILNDEGAHPEMLSLIQAKKDHLMEMAETFPERNLAIQSELRNLLTLVDMVQADKKEEILSFLETQKDNLITVNNKVLGKTYVYNTRTGKQIYGGRGQPGLMSLAETEGSTDATKAEEKPAEGSSTGDNTGSDVKPAASSEETGATAEEKPAESKEEPAAQPDATPAAEEEASPLPWVLGVLAAVAVGGGGFFLYKKKQGENEMEGGEKELKTFYKKQIKSKNAHKREQRE